MKVLKDYDFEKLNMPVLIVHGRNDGDVSFTHAEQAANRIPNSKLLALDDTDHLVFLSKEYISVKNNILEFVNSHLDNESVNQSD